jgi:poly-gamma-glutamate synthesis protein (capsule biosynthesis protein)
MFKKRFLRILIVIFLILLALSICGTILLSVDDSSYDLGHDEKSIAVTGDVMFGRKMPAVLDSGESPFRYVENVTKNADVLLVNFENPVTTSSYAVKGDVPLKADPKYTYLLSGANDVVVASQANNHALDYGEAGLNESIRNLKEAGIYVIGAGMNSAEASQPVVIESGDRKITILNYMDADNFAEYRGVMDPATANSSGYSAYDSELAERQIQEARENGSSIIIAYLHYGNEYSRSPNDNQVKISHELINDGADIVIGSHAHVTQGVEMYNGKPIFYNLGNFIFDQSNPATHISYFLNLDLVEDNCTVTLYPTYISNYLPTFMDAESGKALINGLYPQCDEMNVTDEGTGVLTFKLGNVTNETS